MHRSRFGANALAPLLRLLRSLTLSIPRQVIEADDDGVVSPEEYIIFNLKKMDKVDQEASTL